MIVSPEIVADRQAAYKEFTQDLGLDLAKFNSLEDLFDYLQDNLPPGKRWIMTPRAIEYATHGWEEWRGRNSK